MEYLLKKTFAKHLSFSHKAFKYPWSLKNSWYPVCDPLFFIITYFKYFIRNALNDDPAGFYRCFICHSPWKNRTFYIFFKGFQSNVHQFCIQWDHPSRVSGCRQFSKRFQKSTAWCRSLFWNKPCWRVSQKKSRRWPFLLKKKTSSSLTRRKKWFHPVPTLLPGAKKP